jgi:hypothetical protein
MKHTTLPAITILALAAAPAQAAVTFVAYHDMAGPAYGAGVNITNQYTSNSTGTVASPAAATVGLIRYADGVSTGVSVNISGISNIDYRTSSIALPPAGGTPADPLFNGVGLSLNRGIINRQNGLMTITLSGLNPAMLYDLAFYGDRNSGADGTEQFTLGGADSATNTSSTGIASTFVTLQETRPNSTTGNIIRWSNINPGSDGIITVEVDPRAGTGSPTLDIAYLSAMRLEAFAATPTNTYANWIATYNVGGLTAKTDDPDHDGIPNAIENLFGTHPGQFSQGITLISSAPGVFTFTHPQNASPASDLTSAYTWSSNLAAFHTGGSTHSGTTVNFTTQPNTPAVGTTTVTATATGIVPARLFFRIESDEN